MFSACLISLPPEALNRMVNRTAGDSGCGNAAERRGALWVAAIAMAVGFACAMLS